MNSLKCALAITLAMLVAAPAAACFKVYNQANQLQYSSPNAPIDMSYQIHQRLPAAFPGGHLVFGQDGECAVIDIRKISPELSNRVVPVSTRLPARPRPPRADRQ